MGKIKKIILFAVILLFLMIRSVSATTHISSCGNLNIPGETYILDNDIYYSGILTCITLHNQNVTLDCNNHKIIGNYNGRGIYGSYSYDYYTIKNCVVMNFGNGIDMDTGYYRTILNTESNSNSGYGFRLCGWYYNFDNNLAYNNSNYGVFSQKGCSLKNSTLSNNRAILNKNSGFDISGDYNVFRNNTFLNNTADGLDIAPLTDASDNFIRDSRFNTVINNSASYNINMGFNDNGANSTFDNNLAVSNNYGFYSCTGNTTIINNRATLNNRSFYITISNAIIINNMATYSNQYGFYLYSTNSTFLNNTANSNTYGIYFNYGRNDLLKNNLVSNNTYGLFLYDADRNDFIKNNVSNNQVGVNISYGSTDNSFNDNLISNNLNYGFYVFGKNNFTNNRIIYNQVGMNISGINSSVYNNYFDNTINAWSKSPIFWNTTKTLGRNIVGSYFIGGNYWNDYNGNDTSIPPDGIGDTNIPYNSNGNIINGGDYFPLIPPITISNCQNITKPGIYIATQDISSTGSCLNVTVNNTIIDFQNYTLKGGGIGKGIIAENVNLTIVNLKVENFEDGLVIKSPTSGDIFSWYYDIIINGIDSSYNKNNGITIEGKGRVYSYSTCPPFIVDCKMPKINLEGNGGNGMEITNSSCDPGDIFSYVYCRLYNINTNNNQKSGILITGSSGLTISNTNSDPNENGIVIEDSSNITIENATVFENNITGIIILNSTNITIKNSKIFDNQMGINLTNSNNNLIYNNLFNNVFNAYDNGDNLWNITKTPGESIVGGPYLGGNYWNDYTGQDLDKDVLGDTPYNIQGGSNKDYLPLVMPLVMPLVLYLSPNQIWAEKTVTADVICNVDCSGKTAYVGRGERKVTVCYNYTCLANGCSCTFTAPKLLDTEYVETYYARIDLDGNKIYNETETTSDDLTIYCNAKGASCNSDYTCCAGAYCISGTCQYPSGPGCGKNCLLK